MPLMMTVKAVVTFENFRSESVDPRNFVVPREYKRSRRMSKEKYMAGVAAAAASASGGGKGGNFDSDDEEEEEVEVEEEDEGALSEGEILRRRAASRNAFDDDEVRRHFGFSFSWGGFFGGGRRFVVLSIFLFPFLLLANPSIFCYFTLSFYWFVCPFFPVHPELHLFNMSFFSSLRMMTRNSMKKFPMTIRLLHHHLLRLFPSPPQAMENLHLALGPGLDLDLCQNRTNAASPSHPERGHVGLVRQRCVLGEGGCKVFGLLRSEIGVMYCCVSRIRDGG